MRAQEATARRESAGTAGTRRSAETEEAERIVRATTAGTVRVITGTAEATVRDLTGITTAATVQTIIAGIVRREDVRMEGRATVRAALTAVGAGTVPREDVRITAADRAEGIRWDVR